jgi:crotonobetainyl-CoA:carnitine CoA-transferase CaiB-like acyl-CoA transferase
MTAPGQASPLPLAHVRVLDLCQGPGSSAARLLADLGADVIVVESPQTQAQHRGEALGEVIRAVQHANKRSIVLDLSAGSDDLGTFWDLARGCDIVFEESAPDDREAPVNAHTLRERLPHVVTVAVTGFGQSGPYRDWTGSEAVYVALSGELSRSGLPGREPLLPPGRIATESAAVQAALSALLAYTARLDTGQGQLVDFSLLEAVTQTLDPGWGMGGSASGGRPAAADPRGRPDTRERYPTFRCADGYVRLCLLSARQWQGMFTWLGEPQELADPALASLGNRFAAADRIHPAIERLFSTRTRAQIVDEARAYGVAAGAVLTPSEVFGVEQFQARRAFAEVEVGQRTALVANGMVEVDGARAGIRFPAPAPDADRTGILAESPARPADGPTMVAAGEPRLPLSRVRVLDLGVIVAGAETSRLLADMGAEVIKVENSQFPDGGRQTLGREPISYGVVWGHRNKESLSLNLRTSEGVKVLKELVAQADVVLSNFKPGTMEKLGLSYEELAAINPAIVVAESSAYGPTGPWRDRMGYGPLVRCEVGLSGLWRYPDDPAGFSDATTVYPDHTAGRVGATAVLALLLRRRLTGQGGRVSIAQAEIILNQMAVELAVESVRPGTLTAVGNALPGDAPRGVYPCLGDDEWVVVDVRGHEQFARLARTIGRPEWIADEQFGDPDARVAHRDLLDGAVASWTAQWTPKQAAGMLQAAGIPAAMMLRVIDMLHDPHFAERRFLRRMSHPLVAHQVPAENHPAVFEAIPDAPLRPAPLAGQQSRQVLHRLLGYDDQRIDSLVRAGAVEEAEPTAPAHPLPAHH